MRTLELSAHAASVEELLGMARQENVLVTTGDGESFLISVADDFSSEIELLRRNHDFLALLDELKADRETVTFEDVEKALR